MGNVTTHRDSNRTTNLRCNDVQPNAAKNIPLPEIHRAIQNQDIAKVNSLLYGGKEDLKKTLHTTDDKGTTPLHLAVDLSNFKLVKKLFSAGADINRKDLCMMTPLHIAAGGGHLEILKWFLKVESSAYWNERDIWGWTPLHRAIINHHLEAAMLLLDKGCLVNVPDENKRVALHVAGSYGDAELTKKLLDCGAKIDWQDARGRTALYLAVVNGKHAEVVKLLIERGCNMDLVTTARVTPLGLAAQKGHWECVEALVTEGAKCCNQRVNNTDTVPLESALLRASNQNAKKYKQFRDIVQLLIQADGEAPSSQSFFIALHALQGTPTDDMLHILHMLLCANAQPSVPVTLQSNPAEPIVNSLVQYYLKSCVTLQDLCRKCIRKHLQSIYGNVVYAVSKMDHLPVQLKDIILLKDLYKVSIESSQKANEMHC